jgi:uncharacterized protein HemX
MAGLPDFAAPTTDHAGQSMTARNGAQSPFQQRAPQSLAGKLLAFVLSAALLVLGFMFSLVALAVIAVAGVALGGWLWWKTRALRRHLREQATARQGQSGRAGQPSDSDIIEGEVIREFTAPAEAGRLLR